MAEIALAEEPFEVAIGGGLDVVRAEGRLFVAITHAVGFMTLLAVLAVEDRAGGYRIGTRNERIDSRVILCWNPAEV